MNAVKYAPDGEPVMVSASAMANRVEIRVTAVARGFAEAAYSVIVAVP